MDFQVLSITAPGTQRLQPEEAVPLARDANDFLANAVQRHPDRFAAFATLLTPNPKAAAEELYRCVTELKFVGAMLFPRTGSEFLDHGKFRPIFEVAAEFKVPLYLHPALPPAVVRQAYYAGFGSATDLMLSAGGWAWHAEAGLAALRLILAGTFDRHPHLELILGHWERCSSPSPIGPMVLHKLLNLNDGSLTTLQATSTRPLAESSVTACCEFDTSSSAEDALISWLPEIIAYTHIYRGVTTPMTAAIEDPDSALHNLCVTLRAAGARLLASAQAPGRRPHRHQWR